MTEDQIIEKYGKQCRHCLTNTPLPYEYEFNCISCGYNINKRKHEITKIQRKKVNFLKSFNYAEQKTFRICIDVYEIYENNDYDKINEALAILIHKKLKVNNKLIEKYNDMNECPDSEQNYY